MIEEGLEGEFSYEVTDDMVAGHIKEAKVLSTPSMISLMEISSHRLVEESLPEGYTTVGTKVCVTHEAPAPVGSVVRVRVRLKEVDGRRLTFEVAAYWGDTLLGRGEHERYVVNLEKFIRKLKGALRNARKG